MNEKNEQDIFKDLIDSIHVEDDVDSAKRESSHRADLPPTEIRRNRQTAPVGRLPRKDQRPLRQEDKPRQAVPKFPTEKRKAGRRKGSR